MKKYAIDLDITKCISCGACSIACMDQNDFQVKEGQRPFRNVFDLEMEQKGEVKYSHLSLACMHCSDAPCITACPSACLRKDPETNLTVYDTTNCIGCHSCAMACPYGIPSFGENGKMIKCDGCYVRVHHGMLPACVKACPVKALQLVDTEAKEPQIQPEHSLRMTSAGMLKQPGVSKNNCIHKPEPILHVRKRFVIMILSQIRHFCLVCGSIFIAMDLKNGKYCKNKQEKVIWKKL